jgi:hypothetical protein
VLTPQEIAILKQLPPLAADGALPLRIDGVSQSHRGRQALPSHHFGNNCDAVMMNRRMAPCAVATLRARVALWFCFGYGRARLLRRVAFILSRAWVS